jgi:hypothetical protein
MRRLRRGHAADQEGERTTGQEESEADINDVFHHREDAGDPRRGSAFLSSMFSNRDPNRAE